MKKLLTRIKNSILTVVYSALLTVCFRPKVMYEDPEQKKNPPQGIYIVNHIYLFDGLLMRSIFKKADLYSLITTKWYNKKVARSLVFYEKCIPIDRNNPGTEWIHLAKEAFKEGGSVNIFPEGHTSRSEEMDVFKPGFLMLAFMVKGMPIIPVANCGMYKVFGKRKRILVGKPIYPDRKRLMGNSAQLEEYAEEFRQIIADMKKQIIEM